MRKLIVGEWLSVDGFAADEKDTTDFLAAPEWSAGSDDDMLTMMNQVDTILLGANTYRQFLTYWPAATTDKGMIADRLNQTPKLVFSNSLHAVEWGKWEAPTLIPGRAEEKVRKLKQEPGKDIILWGSITLFQSLLRAGLVDELHLRTVPILLGKGRSLFTEGNKIELQSKSTIRYDSGLVLNELIVQN